MTKDLGAWTAEDCALVLIDYQNEMFEVIRSETRADLVELHVRLLAKTAMAFGMPIVLSTIGVEWRTPHRDLPHVRDRSGAQGRVRRAVRHRRRRRALADRAPHRHRTAGARRRGSTALAVVTELFRDWAAPLAAPARDVIYWYFNEVPKLTGEVGVAKAEKLAASAQGGR